MAYGMLMRMRIVILLVLALVAAAGESWTLPRNWTGKKLGTSEGNPLVDNAGPRWRIVQIYPDRADNADNWKTMFWVEEQKALKWFNNAGSQGGQPSLRVEKGQLNMGVYGKGTNAEWTKVPGVVFIAPRDGVFKVVQETSYKNWEGGGAVTVRYHKISTVLKAVEEINSDIAGAPEPRRGASRPVQLAKGDELSTSFWIDGHHTGASVLSNLVVTPAKLPD